jgi:hypothetical protein
MSTITTNFPTASVRRSHATRFADGVVAGYIHALAGSVSQAAGAQPRLVAAVIEAKQTEASHGATETSHGDPEAPRDAGRPRKSACWSRGGRVSHVMRAQRQLDAR